MVHLKVASVYFDLPPAEIIKMRGTGKPFKEIYAGEYKKKHGKKEEKEKRIRKRRARGGKRKRKKVKARVMARVWND